MAKLQPIEVVGCLSVLFAAGVFLLFYGSIIAVASHFILKFW